MLEYQREECSRRAVTLAASLFCDCGTPFVDIYRHIPCNHVFCSRCVLTRRSNDKCPTCKSRSETLELLHPNDSVYVCTANGCNKGFCNFQSLRMHGDMAHGIYAENIVEYYQQTGDKHVVFGDVQKITHEAVQEPVETREETDKDVDMEQGDSVVQTKPERVPTEKPLLQMDTYSDREHNDDLEELM